MDELSQYEAKKLEHDKALQEYLQADRAFMAQHEIFNGLIERGGRMSEIVRRNFLFTLLDLVGKIRGLDKVSEEQGELLRKLNAPKGE
jgi:hypothetical protein